MTRSIINPSSYLAVNKEFASRNTSFYPPAPQRPDGKVYAHAKFQTGSGSPSASIKLQGKLTQDTGWIYVNSTWETGLTADAVHEIPWFPQYRAVCAITQGTATAATDGVFEFIRNPYHGETLILDDGVKHPVFIRWYQTGGNDGVDDGHEFNDPYSFYLPIRGEPGGTAQQNDIDLNALILYNALTVGGKIYSSVAMPAWIATRTLDEVFIEAARPGTDGNIALADSSAGSVVGTDLTNGANTAQLISLAISV